MNLAYYSDFKSRSNNHYRIEIYTKAAAGTAKELLLSANPFTAEWEADSVYKPLKMSNAVCSILIKEILIDLYTGEAQGVEVCLRNLSTNTLEWFGYVTPNLYSSDYITPLDSVDIEAIDSIACLENIKYSYMGEKADFRSFLSIILYILDKADPRENVNKLYVHDCNRVTSASTSCIMDDLYIHERNFFDEDNEPMTCKDVLSSLVEYLGMTLIQWKDAYYIVDYDYLQSDYANFFMYLRDTSNVKLLTLPLARLNVRDIGVASSNGSISLDNVYNKVSVTANMNPIDDLSPDLFDDEDLKNQNSDPNKYYEQTIKETVFLSAYFESKENWAVSTPQINNNGNIENAGILTNISAFKLYKGAFFQKNSSYSSDSLEPSSVDWNTYLTFVRTRPPKSLHESFLILKKNNTVMFIDGYIIIDFSYKLSKLDIADYEYDGVDDMEYTEASDATKFYCKLKIGDYYYDGEKWLLYSEYLNNISYYNQTIGFEDVSDVRKYYKKDSAGNKTYIEKMEYYKIYAQDRFLIIRKNKDRDKVYDTWYNPTNQVSYKENLSNSSDGVLIKLPNFSVFGNFEIELEPPTLLGGMDSPNGETPDGNRVHFRFCHIKYFNVKYTNKKYVYDVFGNAINDMEDIVYSNVINDNYITESEDVELLVNSYSKGILSYSNVATKKDGKFDYLKSVYNRIAGGEYLPEQILIDKLYRHHKTPKFIYQNSLNYKFSPFDMIKENSLDKTMAINTLGVDYANDSVDVTLIEL